MTLKFVDNTRSFVCFISKGNTLVEEKI